MSLKVVKNIPPLFIVKEKKAHKITKEKYPLLYGVLLKKKNDIQKHYNQWVSDKENITFPYLVFYELQFDKLKEEIGCEERCFTVYIYNVSTPLVKIMGVGYYNGTKMEAEGFIGDLGDYKTGKNLKLE